MAMRLRNVALAYDAVLNRFVEWILQLQPPAARQNRDAISFPTKKFVLSHFFRSFLGGVHENAGREGSDFVFFGLRMIQSDPARSRRGLQPIFDLGKLEKQRKIRIFILGQDFFG